MLDWRNRLDGWLHVGLRIVFLQTESKHWAVGKREFNGAAAETLEFSKGFARRDS